MNDDDDAYNFLCMMIATTYKNLCLLVTSHFILATYRICLANKDRRKIAKRPAGRGAPRAPRGGPPGGAPQPPPCRNRGGGRFNNRLIWWGCSTYSHLGFPPGRGPPIAPT